MEGSERGLLHVIFNIQLLNFYSKISSFKFLRVITKGAGGGLGSGGVGSSRGALAVSVLELHKDEEIYFLVGQKGEHACIKSMGYRDKECEPKDNEPSEQPRNSKTKQVKNLVLEDGAGGGGGATYVFLLNSVNEVVPLVVAAGGGGLGIGRYLDDHDQHGRIVDPEGINVSGQLIGEMNKTGGPGGGWRAHEDYALSVNMGAALLEGSRGGEPCYTPRGIHGNRFRRKQRKLPSNYHYFISFRSRWFWRRRRWL